MPWYFLCSVSSVQDEGWLFVLLILVELIMKN